MPRLIERRERLRRRDVQRAGYQRAMIYFGVIVLKGRLRFASPLSKQKTANFVFWIIEVSKNTNPGLQGGPWLSVMVRYVPVLTETETDTYVYMYHWPCPVWWPFAIFLSFLNSINTSETLRHGASCVKRSKNQFFFHMHAHTQRTRRHCDFTFSRSGRH